MNTVPTGMQEARMGKVGFRLVILVCFVLGLALGSSNLYLRYERRQALAVIDSLNQVAVGTSGDAAVDAIIKAGGDKVEHCHDSQKLSDKASGSCQEVEQQYGVSFGLPHWLNRTMVEHPLVQQVTKYFGVHPWMVEVSLTRVNDAVKRIFFLSAAGRTDGATITSLTSVSSEDSPGSGQSPLYQVTYRQTRNLLPELHIWISPVLSLDERKRLATPNLKCLTTIRGCFETSEISPAAWGEYTRQSN